MEWKRLTADWHSWMHACVCNCHEDPLSSLAPDTTCVPVCHLDHANKDTPVSFWAHYRHLITEIIDFLLSTLPSEKTQDCSSLLADPESFSKVKGKYSLQLFFPSSHPSWEIKHKRYVFFGRDTSGFCFCVVFFKLQCQRLVTDLSLRRVSVEVIKKEDRIALYPAYSGEGRHRTRNKDWVEAGSLENTAFPGIAQAWPWDGGVTAVPSLTLDHFAIMHVLLCLIDFLFFICCLL